MIVVAQLQAHGSGIIGRIPYDIAECDRPVAERYAYAARVILRDGIRNIQPSQGFEQGTRGGIGLLAGGGADEGGLRGYRLQKAVAGGTIIAMEWDLQHIAGRHNACFQQCVFLIQLHIAGQQDAAVGGLHMQNERVVVFILRVLGQRADYAKGRLI